MLFKTSEVSGACLSLLVATLPVLRAQAAEPARLSETATPSQGGELDEVIVTANKRSQALQDVGVTAVVLGASELAERKITSLADIAQAVPGLSYSVSESNTPVFTLRGVGFNEASLAAYPTVSVYIDEAPLAFPALASQGAFDLQRIEVLKGPQGTLFGENSTGGAINYIAAKPTDQFSQGEDVSYSSFNTKEINAFVSGPLTDTLKARVSAHIIRGDGWQQSYTRNDTLGKTEVYAGRAILDWTPLSTARFALTLTAWEDKSDPQAGQLVAIDQQIPAGGRPGITNYPYPPRNDRAADWSETGTSPSGATVPFRPKSDRKLVQAILRSDVDLSDTVMLTSLTSFVHLTQHQVEDYDGTALNDDDIPFNDGSIRSAYEELRLTNGAAGDFRWIVGSNYQQSRILESDAITYSDSSESIPALNNLYENGYESNTNRRDYAFFGNTEYDVTRQVTLVGGARYTDNRTDANICNYDLGDGKVAGLVTELGSLLTGTTLPPLKASQCVSLDYQNIPGPRYIDTLHQDNVSWRVGVNYKPVDGLLLYATGSRGYKAGSFPTVSASSFNQYNPVTQESVLAYEAGIKTTFLNRMVTVDAAAFHYEYDNKQIRGKVLDPVFGVLNALVNVPKSHIYGAEAEAGWHPLRGLDFNLAVTYVETRIDEYEGTSVLGAQENFAGNGIPFSPKWQAELDGQYRWNMGAVSPFVGGDVEIRSATSSYIDGQNITIPTTASSSSAPGVLHPFEINSYTLINLRAGLDWDEGRWSAMLWGKNVANRYYWQNVIYAYDTGFRFAGRPATYGITVSYKF
jgi:iron complex outermembrane receptor protein